MHTPKIVRRVHPDLNHTHKCTHDIPPHLSIIVITRPVHRAFLPFELAIHEIDCILIVAQGSVGVVIAELGEVEVGGGRWWGVEMS